MGVAANSKMGQIPDYLTQSYPRISLKKYDFADLAKESPLEELIKSNKITKGKYWLRASSDALRMLLLYNIGGVYFDTDVISLKPLPWKESFIIAEKTYQLNGAYLGFQKNHPFVLKLLQEIVMKRNIL